MTIQNIDSSNINKFSDIHLTILNNDQIKNKLNVIIVHFNTMKFTGIKEWSMKFRNEMLLVGDVDLIIAELRHDNNFEITEENDDICTVINNS